MFDISAAFDPPHRHTASHALNEASSRSHAIFSLQLHRRRHVYKLVGGGGGGGDAPARYVVQPQKGAALCTRANLVDLAGSEDQRDAQVVMPLPSLQVLLAVRL